MIHVVHTLTFLAKLIILSHLMSICFTSLFRCIVANCSNTEPIIHTLIFNLVVIPVFKFDGWFSIEGSWRTLWVKDKARLQDVYLKPDFFIGLLWIWLPSNSSLGLSGQAKLLFMATIISTQQPFPVFIFRKKLLLSFICTVIFTY